MSVSFSYAPFQNGRGDAKEQTSWIPVETYIQDRTDAEFSHGFCPDCLKKLYHFEYDK